MHSTSNLCGCKYWVRIPFVNASRKAANLSISVDPDFTEFANWHLKSVIVDCMVVDMLYNNADCNISFMSNN